jgi:hypothetical protein
MEPEKFPKKRKRSKILEKFTKKKKKKNRETTPAFSTPIIINRESSKILDKFSKQKNTEEA